MMNARVSAYILCMVSFLFIVIWKQSLSARPDMWLPLHNNGIPPFSIEANDS